jgi:hypothetical protein
VVAAEVKDLSAQTAKATDAIADQIHAIQSSTSTAVGAIQSVSGKVAEIHPKNGGSRWARQMRIAHFHKHEPGNWLASASPNG